MVNKFIKALLFLLIFTTLHTELTDKNRSSIIKFIIESSSRTNIVSHTLNIIGKDSHRSKIIRALNTDEKFYKFKYSSSTFNLVYIIKGDTTNSTYWVFSEDLKTTRPTILIILEDDSLKFYVDTKELHRLGIRLDNTFLDIVEFR